MRLYLTALLMLISPQLLAFTPETGWWWNPDEPGRGYAIEIQDDVVFFAAYGYDSDGLSVWLTAAGRMTGNTELNVSLDYYEAPPLAGNCLACPWSGPATAFPGEGGPMSLVFTSRTTANLLWDGGEMQIERFNYALGDPLERLRGEWQLVLDFSSDPAVFPFGGEILVMDRILVDGAGEYVRGCRPANSEVGQCSANPTRPAAGELDGDTHVIAVDDSADTFAIYYLEMGLKETVGLVEIYNKETLAGQGVFYPVRGQRTASRAFVNTGIGPNKVLPEVAVQPQRPGLGDVLAARQLTAVDLKTLGVSESLLKALPQLRDTADRLAQRLAQAEQ
jgi:hypothetical protein